MTEASRLILEVKQTCFQSKSTSQVAMICRVDSSVHCPDGASSLTDDVIVESSLHRSGEQTKKKKEKKKVNGW